MEGGDRRLHIENRYLRKLQRLFSELSVPVRLMDEDGTCLLPLEEKAFALPEIAVEITSGRTTYRFTGHYDGRHSLSSKLLAHMSSEKESQEE